MPPGAVWHTLAGMTMREFAQLVRDGVLDEIERCHELGMAGPNMCSDGEAATTGLEDSQLRYKCHTHGYVLGLY